MRGQLQMKILLFCSLFVFLSISAQASDLEHIGGSTMGTTYSVKYRQNKTKIDREQLKLAIDKALELVNDLASTYRKNSEISRFNRHTSQAPMKVHPKFASWVKLSKDIHHASDGAFDITMNSLVELWGFGAKDIPKQVPTDQQITSLLDQRHIDKVLVDINKSTLAKKIPSVQIDLSGVAKGAGVDDVAELLESKAITDYMVEIGGEIRTSGTKAAGQAWVIAIEKPVESGRKVQKLLRLNHEAMATSGNYRNFFESNGKRYSHILDPMTGRPITHYLASVTVIAKNCAEADAFATAFMVLGTKRSLAVAKAKGLHAYFIERRHGRFEFFETQGFSQKVLK